MILGAHSQFDPHSLPLNLASPTDDFISAPFTGTATDVRAMG